MTLIPAIELRNVSHFAGGKKILDSINRTVQPSEHWAILGANGAGKSILLKIAYGFVWPNAGGEVRRNGKTLLDLRALRKSIGWVTSSLVAEIPESEKAIRTVVSGKFAQIGLLEQFGGVATASDYPRRCAIWSRWVAVACAIKSSAPYPRARHILILFIDGKHNRHRPNQDS